MLLVRDIMEEFRLEVPVLFCTFKRLDTAKQVFEQIRKVKPQKLYLVSDAARPEVDGEQEKVQAVHDYVESHIDWECEVFRNYATTNMGCGRRIYSGINWIFEAEEQAIILEDDCVPQEGFFEYCQKMLAYYQNDEEILMIGGNNPIAHLYDNGKDYIFSHVPFMWGWATWKRAWKLYDYEMKSWKAEKKSQKVKNAFPLKRAYQFYAAHFDSLSTGKYNDVWDYQFMYTGISHEMLCILPSKSYVQNIGFIEESTHTKNAPKWICAEASPVEFPLHYRNEYEWDCEFDRIYMDLISKGSYVVRIKSKLGLDVNQSVFEIFRK